MLNQLSYFLVPKVRAPVIVATAFDRSDATQTRNFSLREFSRLSTKIGVGLTLARLHRQLIGTPRLQTSEIRPTLHRTLRTIGMQSSKVPPSYVSSAIRLSEFHLEDYVVS